MILDANLPHEKVFPPAIESYLMPENTGTQLSSSVTFIKDQFCVQNFIWDKNINKKITPVDSDKIDMTDYNIIDRDRIFDARIEDAKLRFNKVYKNAVFEIKKYTVFLEKLRSIIYLLENLPRFSFYPDSVKARFIYKNNEFSLECDMEEGYYILLSTFIGDKMFIRDGNIDNMKSILESFRDIIS